MKLFKAVDGTWKDYSTLVMASGKTMEQWLLENHVPYKEI